MSCETTRPLIEAYVDGELDLVRAVEIEQHLQSCAACTRVYRNQQALHTALASTAGALYYTAPAGLQRRIQDSVRKAEPERSIRWVLPWRNLSLVAAVAVVLLASWAVLRFAAAPSGEALLAQEVVAGHVRSLQANHLGDVISTDQHTVKPWFDGKIDFAPPVTDFAAQGFPLWGGRLDYLDNRPVAALVYQKQKHFINVFIWPAPGAGPTTPQALAEQGYNLEHWVQGGMNYWVISDVNSADLHTFVQLLQK
ncbi:MAG TPA: anti-sigma factor [Chloroflexia bacterium]|nr:anti-sigma factor [Chloroflexia bacterium]